jgi:hypothetical protein
MFLIACHWLEKGQLLGANLLRTTSNMIGLLPYSALSIRGKSPNVKACMIFMSAP